MCMYNLQNCRSIFEFLFLFVYRLNNFLQLVSEISSKVVFLKKKKINDNFIPIHYKNYFLDYVSLLVYSICHVHR